MICFAASEGFDLIICAGKATAILLRQAVIKFQCHLMMVYMRITP